MKNQSLHVVKNHPYLGVELADTLKYNLHIDSITAKASSTLGFIKRNLKHCPTTVKERAYQTLVRPKLEYASPIWNPQQLNTSKKIEQIQRNAARFVMNKPYNCNNPSSVTSLLHELKWPTLEQRRQCADLILMYKVFNNLVAVPVEYHPQLSTRYTNSVKFVTYHCRLNAYKHSFFPRTVLYWNNLPANITTMDNLDSFKTAVQSYVFV